MSEKANSEDWELRDEYDFSRGRRGKYADRFGFESGEAIPDWYRQAVHDDQQSWIGEALRRAQDLEGLFVAYLVISSRWEPAAAGDAVVQLVENPEDEVLRRLLDDLRGGGTSAPPELEADLRRVLGERNWLVHKSLQLRDSEAEPDEVREFVERLQGLCESLGSLNTRLEGLMVARLAGKGMSEREYRRRRDEVLRQWLAA